MSAATTSAAAACQESRAAELELAQGDINYLLKITIFTFSYYQVSGAAQESSSKGRLDEAEGEGLAALPLQEADQHQGVRR